MQVKPLKSVRFDALVEAAGNPEQATLWSKPEPGSDFMKAVAENRVATLLQNNIGTKKDVGMIGFKMLPRAAFLVFPKPLPYAPGTRIVGIKYHRIAPSAPKGEVYTHSPKRKRSPAARVPRVKIAKQPTASETMTYRIAERSDLPVLARMNQQLIEDEDHRTRLTLAQLRQRMANWIAGEYRAVLFEKNGQAVGYALFRPEPELIYLRQFFIDRGQRRKGRGKEAMSLLRERVWPKDKRLTVDVLVHNTGAVAFWRSVGFSDYALTLEIMPRTHNRY